MKPICKIIIAIICLSASLVYQFFFEESILLVDKEYTHFLSGLLFGLGISLIIYSIFNPKKNRI